MVCFFLCKVFFCFSKAIFSEGVDVFLMLFPIFCVFFFRRFLLSNFFYRRSFFSRFFDKGFSPESFFYTRIFFSRIFAKVFSKEVCWFVRLFFFFKVFEDFFAMFFSRVFFFQGFFFFVFGKVFFFCQTGLSGVCFLFLRRFCFFLFLIFFHLKNGFCFLSKIFSKGVFFCEKDFFPTESCFFPRAFL